MGGCGEHIINNFKTDKIMAITKKAIGLTEKGIEIGFYKEDGTAPAEADYVSLGKVYKDTAVLETAEGEVVECICEEMDDPEDEHTLPGKTTLKYSTSDLDPTTCKTAFGGTLAAGKWTAPAKIISKTVALRFETLSGLKVAMTKMKLSTRINWAIKKNGYGLLEHSLTKIGGDLSITQPTDEPAE